jgi:hypothetical protein
MTASAGLFPNAVPAADAAHHRMGQMSRSPQDPRIRFGGVRGILEGLGPAGGRIDEGVEPKLARALNCGAPTPHPQRTVQPGQPVSDRRLAAANGIRDLVIPEPQQEVAKQLDLIHCQPQLPAGQQRVDRKRTLTSRHREPLA